MPNQCDVLFLCDFAATITNLCDLSKSQERTGACMQHLTRILSSGHVRDRPSYCTSMWALWLIPHLECIVCLHCFMSKFLVWVSLFWPTACKSGDFKRQVCNEAARWWTNEDKWRVYSLCIKRAHITTPRLPPSRTACASPGAPITSVHEFLWWVVLPTPSSKTLCIVFVNVPSQWGCHFCKVLHLHFRPNDLPLRQDSESPTI